MVTGRLHGINYNSANQDHTALSDSELLERYPCHFTILIAIDPQGQCHHIIKMLVGSRTLFYLI